MIETNPNGIYCPAGDFYVDPWRGVDRAIITHAHADHARPGSHAYLCAAPGAGLLQERLGPTAAIQSIAYGETVTIRGVAVSLHPAGHVLGSAQVRLEHRGEVCVISGDYKQAADPTCEPFTPIRCHTFVTESTFGLPIYRWPSPRAVFDSMLGWWQRNAGEGLVSVIQAYSLGKAQRVLAGIAGAGPGPGPIQVHPAIARLNPHYRAQGVALPEVQEHTARTDPPPGSLLISPMAESSTSRMPPGAVAVAQASGWMRIRGNRRRMGCATGFVLSDHADWEGLVGAIEATQAERVLVTHGYVAPLVRWLNETGREAAPLATRFEGDAAHDTTAPAAAASGPEGGE